MQLHTSDQWVINAPLPPSDRNREFLAWVDSGVRTVRRVGDSEHSVFAPGTTIFTDCTHPLQNKICDESRIQGWRLKQ